MALSHNPNLQALIAGSPLQRDITAFLRSELDKERELYENHAASEYVRGRVNMLREWAEFFEGGKRKAP